MASIKKRGPHQWQAGIRRRGWWPVQIKTFDSEADAQAWARQMEGADFQVYSSLLLPFTTFCYNVKNRLKSKDIRSTQWRQLPYRAKGR